MKHIEKGCEPQSLTLHRRHKGADYDNYEQKDDLRSALLREQGGICCYCMRRISSEEMKIEHWACRRKHQGKQLEYRNLLAACDGGEGQAKHLQHCDTHKGDNDIRIHPADPRHNCEDFIRYQADGEIYSEDNRINDDLNGVLHLNLQWIRVYRKAALDGALARLRRKRPDGNWTTAFLQTEMRRWSDRDAGGLYCEFCAIVGYHLRKKIARRKG